MYHFTLKAINAFVLYPVWPCFIVLRSRGKYTFLKLYNVFQREWTLQVHVVFITAKKTHFSE